MIGLLQSGTGNGSGICLPIVSSRLLGRCAAARDARDAPDGLLPPPASAPPPLAAIAPPAPPPWCPLRFPCTWRGAVARRRLPPAPAAVRRALAGAREALCASETDAADASSPVRVGGVEDGTVGELPAPPPAGLVGVAPVLVGVSVGVVLGWLGVVPVSAGVDTLTSGVDTVAAGVDTVTPGSVTATPGSVTATPGTVTPTPGSFTPIPGGEIPSGDFAEADDVSLACAPADPPASTPAPAPVSPTTAAIPARVHHPAGIL